MKLKSQLYATQTGLPIWTLLRANKKTKRKAKKGDKDSKTGDIDSRHNANSSLLSKEEEEEAYDGARKMLVFDDKALE
jgi:hypothetical protein